MKRPHKCSMKRRLRVRHMRALRGDATRNRKARAATLARATERALKASPAEPDPVRWLTYNA